MLEISFDDSAVDWFSWLPHEALVVREAFFVHNVATSVKG